MPEPTEQSDANAGGEDRGGDAPARASEVVQRSAVGVRPRPTPQPRVELCPYCGAESINTTRCDRCAGKFDALSKQATQNAMGPWFLRDEGRPHRPGCAYETIRAMVARGSITQETILRGPTTRQFWTRAAQTPGVAHLLGACHSCRREVDPGAFMCPACGVSFQPETDRQHLGLSAVSLLPGQATPERVAAVSVPTGSLQPMPTGVPTGATVVPISPPQAAGMPERVAALNAEWGLGPRELDLGDTPTSGGASRRPSVSGAGVVAAALCGLVVGVMGLGGVLVWARGGLEPALASLGLGNGAPGGTVVAERGVSDQPPNPSPTTPTPTAGSPAGASGEPIGAIAAAPTGPDVAASEPSPAAADPASAVRPPAASAVIGGVLRSGEAGSLREARALVDRFEGDASLTAEGAAAWRAALDAREALIRLGDMP
ncbi:MAG: hypothetical protein H6809_01700 [Phycisphaeraceae bacterium]|nr:hypothetical protein [Phycisphaeraceae bacterium]